MSSLHGVCVCVRCSGRGRIQRVRKAEKAHKAYLPGVAIGSIGNLHCHRFLCTSQLYLQWLRKGGLIYPAGREESKCIMWLPEEKTVLCDVIQRFMVVRRDPKVRFIPGRQI